MRLLEMNTRISLSEHSVYELAPWLRLHFKLFIFKQRNIAEIVTLLKHHWLPKACDVNKIFEIGSHNY